MELAQEEFMGSNDLTQIIKGKRTKRQRSSSPHKVPVTDGGAATVSSSTSSSGCGDGDGCEIGEGVFLGEEYYGASISSHTSCSTEVYESTEEEEDMANCLILLAKGDSPKLDENNSTSRIEKFNSRKFSAATTTTKAGFYVYECKTCNRSFPSFQALGGHRASHKKPKIEEKKPVEIAAAAAMVNDDDSNLEDCQLNKSSSTSTTSDHHHHPHHLPLQISTINNKGNFLGNNSNNNKAKIHECSICGSEFTSGQALGGHMRRHRANTVNNNQVTIAVAAANTTSDHTSAASNDQIKPRAILSLDLNLPAPEDDQLHRESKFQFMSTQQALMFSATVPALVDCHY